MATYDVKTIIAGIQKLQDTIKKTEAQIMDSNLSDRLKYAHDLVETEDRLEEIIRRLRKDPTYTEDVVTPKSSQNMGFFQRFKTNAQNNMNSQIKALEEKTETPQIETTEEVSTETVEENLSNNSTEEAQADEIQ